MSANSSDAIDLQPRRAAEIVASIMQGLADMQAGRTIPHDEAMAELDRFIEQADEG